MARLTYEFYHRPCVEVARDLVGKVLVFQGQRLRISETEAYCGESDTACHASKGRTKRTEVMYTMHVCVHMHTPHETQPPSTLTRAHSPEA